MADKADEVRGMLDTSTVIWLGALDPAHARAPAGALIAASAIAEGIPLYTCNPADFAGIDDLDLRAIPHPGQRS